MRITIHVENNRYDIDIVKPPHQDTIEKVVVNGKEVEVDITPDWLKQFSKTLIIGSSSYQVEFELDRQGIPREVWTVGQSAKVKVDFPGKGKLKRPEMTGLWGESDRIRASLPGKVIGILVEAGQEVKRGDIICLLEAMKMENELRSPRDGVVREILIDEGALVEMDQVLVRLK